MEEPSCHPYPVCLRPFAQKSMRNQTNNQRRPGSPFLLPDPDRRMRKIRQLIKIFSKASAELRSRESESPHPTSPRSPTRRGAAVHQARMGPVWGLEHSHKRRRDLSLKDHTLRGLPQSAAGLIYT